MKFGISEVMIILAWSSLGVSFPWWMWLVPIWDLLLRIDHDHKEWLREKQERLKLNVAELEGKRNALYDEIDRLKKPNNHDNH